MLTEKSKKAQIKHSFRNCVP